MLIRSNRKPLAPRQPGPPTTGWQWRFANRRVVTESAATSSSAARSPKLARVEAALFVANGALTLRKLVQVAMLIDGAEAVALLAELNAAYDDAASAFRVEKVATGYQLLTRPEFVGWLDRIHHRQEREKLSPAAIETLAIVAYRQPITRADIEAIRGVQAAEIIKQLMERNLVRVVGEDDSLGRPYLYGTTKQFLENFGLQGLNELPLTDLLGRNPTPSTDDDDHALASSATDDEPVPLTSSDADLGEVEDLEVEDDEDDEDEDEYEDDEDDEDDDDD